MNNEQKAREFLQYVAENEKELKYILAKNTTYDKELFDDVFNDTIIKVYNSIIKNGTDVNDYKNYFFISLKWQYILQQNRANKRRNSSVRDFFDNNNIIEEENVEEDKFNNISGALDTLKKLILDKYGEWWTYVYFQYYQCKAEEGCSYRKLSAKLGINQKQISMIVKEIKKFVAEDDNINKLREVFKIDYGSIY